MNGKNILLGISILTNVLLIILIISSVYMAWSSTNDSRNAIPFEQMAEGQNSISIVSQKVIFEDNNIYVEVVGKNIGDRVCEGSITAKFYDSGCYLIGSTTEYIANIDSGETFKIKINSPHNNNISTVNLSIKSYGSMQTYDGAPIQTNYNILKYNNSQIIEVVGKNTNNKKLDGYILIKYYDGNNILIGQNEVYLSCVSPNEEFKFKTNYNTWIHNNYTISKCKIYSIFDIYNPVGGYLRELDNGKQTDIKIISQKLSMSKNGQAYVELIGENTAKNSIDGANIQIKFYNDNNILIGCGEKYIKNIGAKEKFRLKIYCCILTNYHNYNYYGDGKYNNNANPLILGYDDEVSKYKININK
ncbi:hypothetical protein [Methanococcus aeolicus]|uniref:hypothetical protein n=1 Tax=Methanococcus aeolicus TaxID=42879 RepID=UPI0021C61DA9|nr:hypothetical protein [Methanococcus aeolicus]UXM84018.1 hypothetical protein N6C89_04415 [Methanococcus aeolicus]